MECNLQRISLIAIWFLPVPCTNFINKKKKKKFVCIIKVHPSCGAMHCVILPFTQQLSTMQYRTGFSYKICIVESCYQKVVNGRTYSLYICCALRSPSATYLVHANSVPFAFSPPLAKLCHWQYENLGKVW